MFLGRPVAVSHGGRAAVDTVRADGMEPDGGLVCGAPDQTSGGPSEDDFFFPEVGQGQQSDSEADGPPGEMCYGRGSPPSAGTSGCRADGPPCEWDGWDAGSLDLAGDESDAAGGMPAGFVLGAVSEAEGRRLRVGKGGQ